MQTPPSPVVRDIYSVSRINREARTLLTMSFPLLWVEGEVSNLATPSSGHLYFTLKDDQACVRCAMFKNQNLYRRLKLVDGMQVVLRARVSLYEPRGEFQLIAEYAEEAGFGALQRAFEALKQRLAAEGLFDPARKQSVSRFPRRLGIITSPAGAAIRDILCVLRRRFPVLPVLIYPTTVQGEGAADSIAHAIALASRRRECDVLILARGGGSLEDLWAFNTEVVARAVAGCEIPMICGVGHEIDFTIADLVADHRAPTPTSAAELVSLDRAELLVWLDKLEQRLNVSLAGRCQTCARSIDWLRRRLDMQHPQQRLRMQIQRVDDLEHRLRLAVRYVLKALTEQQSELAVRLQCCSPDIRLARASMRYERLTQRLLISIRRRLQAYSLRLDRLSRLIDTVNPVATLSRGYALVTRAQDGVLLRDSESVVIGESLRIQLATGEIGAKVTEHASPRVDTGKGEYS
jgi:exodeoxyribonuclease VII large subunit